MIDWLTMKIPFFYPGLINGGMLILLDENGESVLEAERGRVFHGHSSNILIKTCDVDHHRNTTCLSISGNPSKFLQGHNIIGTCDLHNLVIELAICISKKLEVQQPDFVVKKIKNGDYTFSRIDINKMFIFDRISDVSDWLQHVAKLSKTRNNLPIMRGKTIYWNFTSKRWTMKAYSKGEELKKNKFELSSNKLLDLANSSLRIELTLKSVELRSNNIFYGFNWFNKDPYEAWDQYFSKIQINSSINVKNALIEFGNRSLAHTYHLWKTGCSMKYILPNTTFYRHRKKFLEYGIDISIPFDEDNKLNSIYMKDIKELHHVDIPEWAIQDNLVFIPRNFYTLEELIAAFKL